MPIVFCIAGSGSSGFDGVGSGGSGVSGNMSGCGSMTGGPGGSSGRSVISIAGGGVGAECCGARYAALDFATGPSASGFDGFARAVVFRINLLEEREDVLGAIGGPERQCPVVQLVEPLGLFSLH